MMTAAELRELAARSTTCVRLPETVRMVVLLYEPASGNVGWVASIDTRETMLVLQNVLHDYAN